jgi:radical SAM protein with 4Fe4S-binding SPASM domain
MPILSEFSQRSSTICSMAWNHMFIDPSGRVKPCCRFDDKIRPNEFNLNSQTLKQSFDSEFMNSLRMGMIKGERNKGCARCYEEEDSGKKSLRQRYNNRKQYTENIIDLNVSKIEWLELSTSNRCNLACRMCDSRYSSLWFDQENEIYGKTKSPTKVVFSNLENMDIDFKNIKHFKFTGGEPLLDILKL